MSAGCEEEVQEKLALIAEGKDLKTLYLKYAPNGDMNSEQMKELLIDAGVSYWCRWPAKVIEKFDVNEDGKLSWKEVNDALKKPDTNDLSAASTDNSKVETLDVVNKHDEEPALETIKLYESLKSFAELLQTFHEGL